MAPLPSISGGFRGADQTRDVPQSRAITRGHRLEAQSAFPRAAATLDPDRRAAAVPAAATAEGRGMASDVLAIDNGTDSTALRQRSAALRRTVVFGLTAFLTLV